jgi:hypothetical protein
MKDAKEGRKEGRKEDRKEGRASKKEDGTRVKEGRKDGKTAFLLADLLAYSSTQGRN